MPQWRVPIGEPMVGTDEAKAVSEAISRRDLSQGSRVARFEELFAGFVGTRFGVAVNSGSSANLLLFSSFRSRSWSESGGGIAAPWRLGDEVVTSAVTWPTSVFPILQVGLVPVFVDVDQDTYCLDAHEVELAVGGRTRAIWPIHLLGHPAEMKHLAEIRKDRRLMLLEDACEAHGAKAHGRRVGGWGMAGTFSFFVSHHMTTGEGGMIATNDERLRDICRSLRAFGRHSSATKDRLATFGKLGEYDARYVFTELGYSMKLTDFQAAMGIEQMKKLEGFIERRRNNARYLSSRLGSFGDLFQLPVEKSWAYHSYLGYAITLRNGVDFTRSELVRFLEANQIETRPVMAGNITDHPCMQGQMFRVQGNLTRTRKIARDSFFIGCHPALNENDLDYIGDVFESFVAERAKR